MTFTSEWEWVSINRNADSYVEESTEFPGLSEFKIRRNWSLSRKRWSNDTYVSAFGDFSVDLTAKNGGVDYTVSSEDNYFGVKFYMSTAVWTTTETIWIESDFPAINGSPVWEVSPISQNLPFSLPNRTLIFRVTLADFSTPWAAVNVDYSEWLASSLDDIANYSDYKIASNTDLTDEFGEDTIFFDGTGSGAFASGTAASELATSHDAALYFCESDVQSWPIDGVDFYQQTQTWSWKSEYANVNSIVG